MITLRTFGADSNSAGASPFVGIPVPIGTKDGDVILVGIALPAAGLTVAPPSVDWVLVAQTDLTLSFGLAVFTKTALNEPANWVFALSSSAAAASVCAVYGGLDPFVPIEVFATQLTAASTTIGIPGLTASEDGEELALFIAGAASGTFTPTGNYIEATRKQQAGATVEFQHYTQQAAGTIAPANETFSTSAIGASVLLVLRPSAETLTVDDVRGRLVDSLPIGADNVYDLTPTGDYYKLFQALAMAWKLYAFGLIDLTRRELVPNLTRYTLPVWEQIFGLEFSQLAKLGTIPQRQGQITTAWRVAAGQSSTIPIVEGLLGPLFGYFASTPVQVIECSRAGLTTAHTYSCHTFSPPNQGIGIVPIGDTGKISSGGATINVLISSAALESATLTLIGPDGTIRVFSNFGSGVAINVAIKLHAIDFVGKQLNGLWILTGTNCTSVAWSIFVEGMPTTIGSLQETSGAIYDWGVYADPTHLGENGTPPNFTAARAQLAKMEFAHTVGSLVISVNPLPDTDSGVNAAIPDECIPT